MRGRKRAEFFTSIIFNLIKKESPNEGTETVATDAKRLIILPIKKESPNEGTETRSPSLMVTLYFPLIKKESPNEGTETCFYFFQIV